MTETKQYLSIRDVCARLGVDYKTIYRQIQSGELPASKIGTVYRIAVEDVESYVASRRQARPAEPRPVAANPLAADLIRVPSEDEERAIAEERLEEARLKLAAGKVEVVVTSVQAKTIEESAVGRFERTLRELMTIRLTSSLLRDLTGRPQPDNATANIGLTKPESFIEIKDDRDQLMDILGIGFLDRRIVETRPLNQRVIMRLPASSLNQSLGRNRATIGLMIELRVLSDMRAHAEDGFATKRLTESELLFAHIAAKERARDGAHAHVMALASTTGWSKSAIEMVKQSGSGGLSDALVMPILVDLTNNSAHFNAADLRIEPFVAFFTPVLRDERIVAAMEAIRAGMFGWESGIFLDELPGIANQTEDIVAAAVQRLIGTRRYRQVRDEASGRERLIAVD